MDQVIHPKTPFHIFRHQNVSPPLGFPCEPSPGSNVTPLHAWSWNLVPGQNLAYNLGEFAFFSNQYFEPHRDTIRIVT